MIRPYHLQIYNVSCTCFYALNNQYSWVVYMYLFLTFNSLQRNQQLFVKKKKKWKFCPQFIFHHLLSLPRYHNLNYIVIGLTMYRILILYSLWTHDKHFLVWIYDIVKSLTCLCVIGRNSLVSCMQNVRRICMFYFSSALQLYTF